MGVDRLRVVRSARKAAWCLASLTSLESQLAVGDVRLVDATGRVLVKLEGVRLRRVPRDWLARAMAGPLPDWCYELAWVPQPLDATPRRASGGRAGPVVDLRLAGSARRPPWPSGWR